MEKAGKMKWIDSVKANCARARITGSRISSNICFSLHKDAALLIE